MNELCISESYRHVDWAVYGVVMTQRILGEDSSFVSDNDLSEPGIYSIRPCRNGGSLTPIGEMLRDVDVPAIERIRLLKQLSAGLRYAFLSGKNIAYVSVQHARHSGHSDACSTLQFTDSDGNFFRVERRAPGRLVEGEAAMVHGGGPLDWFDLLVWRLIRPVGRSSRDGFYPLSEPVELGRRHRNWLKAIGAKPTRNRGWYPPPGTINEDLIAIMNSITIANGDVLFDRSIQ